LELKAPEPRIKQSEGYFRSWAPGHALCAGTSKRVYEHRKVYHDAHGDGPFACHVCGASLTWETMHVDHLDDDPGNNELANLAPACPTCNTWRARPKMVASVRSRGRRVAFNGREMSIREWVEELGIKGNKAVQRVSRRLDAGWSVERALTEPSQKAGRR
jgi:hypothetical protein